MADEINTNQNIPDIPDDLQKEFRVRYELLPPDIQKVIADSNYAKDLFEIAKANKLTYEQLETLQLETFMALLGMNKAPEYRAFLKDQFKKTDAEMDVLISAINERVFDPIKESMKQLYSQQDEYLKNPTIEETEEDTTPENNSSSTTVNKPATNYFSSSLSQAPAGSTSSPQAPENLPVAGSMPIRKTPVMQMQQTAPATQQAFVPASSPSGLSKTEESVLGKAGVVLGQSQNDTGTPRQTQPTMSDRNDLMKGIENPVKSPTGTIMANKLSTSTTLMPNKTTDYSLPRTTPQNSTPASTPAPTNVDPYREKV